MPTIQRFGKPYVWVTWITGLLAGEDACTWKPWFAAHFKFDKADRGFDLAAWKAEHAQMVDARRVELEAEGWTVTVEDQNKITLAGQTALLAGKPDLVATRDRDVLVVDCKGGKQRDSDYWQVLLYMFALPLLWAKNRPDLFTEGPLRFRGEVCYHATRRTIEPEELTRDSVARITSFMRLVGSDERPPQVPSARECRFCDVTANDCPQRIVDEAEPVLVSEF